MSSKVIAPSSIIEAFETLLSSAATTIDEETGNPSYQPCADFYVYCILASLPWGGTELVEVMSKLGSFWGKKNVLLHHLIITKFLCLSKKEVANSICKHNFLTGIHIF